MSEYTSAGFCLSLIYNGPLASLILYLKQYGFTKKKCLENISLFSDNRFVVDDTVLNLFSAANIESWVMLGKWFSIMLVHVPGFGIFISGLNPNAVRLRGR